MVYVLNAYLQLSGVKSFIINDEVHIMMNSSVFKTVASKVGSADKLKAFVEKKCDLTNDETRAILAYNIAHNADCDSIGSVMKKTDVSAMVKAMSASLKH